MKKIFLDANVVVDFLDASSRDHNTAVECFRIIRNHFGIPVVSPVTFIIVNYIFQKYVKNKQWHKKQMKLIFSELEMTPVQPSFVNDSFNSHFIDLEDALQHQCALYAKAVVILTKDIKDYFDSRIPVIHPDDFVNRYNKIV